MGRRTDGLGHIGHGFGFAGKEVATLLFLSALLGKTRLGMASSFLVAMRMTGMMAGSLLMGWLDVLLGIRFVPAPDVSGQGDVVNGG